MIAMRSLLALALLLASMAMPRAAHAGQVYFVSEPFTGSIWRLEDSNGDGDALDVAERTLWGQGFAGLRGLETYAGAIYGVEEGYADGLNQVVRLVDVNGDGDALDVGERIAWAGGLHDPRDVARDASGIWYVSEFAVDLLWRMHDTNSDGDVLDVGERTLFADGVNGPQTILPHAGALIVPAESGDQVHRLIDLNGDGDALDIGENAVLTPHFDQVLGVLDDGAGGFFFTAFSADTVYHAEDRNADGDFLDVAEVLSYADAVYGLLDGPWNMVAYKGGGFLLTDSNNNQVKLVRDINGDGDALDLGEVVLFADGINAPVDIVALTVGLPGDYNDDGSVDAADYVMWRKNVGAPAGILPNDIDGGIIGPAQYATWRAYFGEPSGVGTAVAANSSTNATVPEPSSLILLTFMALLAHLPRQVR
jgi:hypothetical protein